jgi:hypothetical protein
MQTARYRGIQKVVDKMKHFTAIKKLDIVLHTPPNGTAPVSLEQLNHVLPFYELEFTRWGLLWQTSYMSRPETVCGWPITYLDKERFRIDSAAQREIESGVEEKVFVHRSEQPKALDLPFVPRTNAEVGTGYTNSW